VARTYVGGSALWRLGPVALSAVAALSSESTERMHRPCIDGGKRHGFRRPVVVFAFGSFEIYPKDRRFAPSDSEQHHDERNYADRSHVRVIPLYLRGPESKTHANVSLRPHARGPSELGGVRLAIDPPPPHPPERLHSRARCHDGLVGGLDAANRLPPLR
jgi:hypothetical protein